MPSETATAVCTLVMGGVLERYPKLKVVFAHGGGAFPYLIGRIAHGHDVRPDLCATENPYTPRYIHTPIVLYLDITTMHLLYIIFTELIVTITPA